jgi:hypothetical protein
MTITRDELTRMVEGWLAAGVEVVGPAALPDGRVAFHALGDAAALRLGGLRPANSIKEAVFPKTERLYGYRVRGRQVQLVDEPAPDRARIVVGARPCDAAALEALDLLFGWDTVDEFYAARRAATTVLTVACREHDEHCFCTSVGLGPADARGSDVLLRETEPGVFHVQSLTAKGAALFAGAEEAGEDGGYAGPPKRFEVGAVRARRFARRVTASTSWTSTGRGSATGIRASTGCSRCTLRGTTRGRRRRSGSGSG